MTTVAPASTRPRSRRNTASASSVLRWRITGADHPMIVAAIFPGAVHLADPASGRIELAVVTHGAVVHPHAVVLAPGATDATLRGLAPGCAVRIGSRRIALPGGDVEVTRWWSPRPALRHLERPALAATADATRTLLAARASTLPDPAADRLPAFIAGLTAMDARAAARAARKLLGLGEGSTPTGDDLLAGAFSAIALFGPALDDPAAHRVIAAARQAGDEVVIASETATTALSAALLRHAMRGEVCDPAGRLLVAMTRRAEQPELRAVLDDLLEVGSSSGRDLACGILAGIDVLLESGADDPAGDAALRARAVLTSSTAGPAATSTSLTAHGRA